MAIYGCEVLKEYSGNDADNKAFAEVLDELEKIGKFYVDLVKHISEHCQKCAKIKPKDANTFKKAMDDLIKDGNDVNDWFNKELRKYDERPTFKRFKSLCKKFSVKYSDVTMEDRKKYHKIFKDLHYQIVDQNVFTDAWYKDINKALDDFREIDKTRTSEYIQHVNAWLSAFYNELQFCDGNIRFVLYKLNIESESSFKYQVVQRLLKSKKD